MPQHEIVLPVPKRSMNQFLLRAIYVQKPLILMSLLELNDLILSPHFTLPPTIEMA